MLTHRIPTPVLAGAIRPAAGSAIGVLLADDENPVYAEAAADMEALARADGYETRRVSAGGDPGRECACIETLLAARVSGIVTMPVATGNHALYAGLPVPAVLLGSRTDSPSLDYVVQDDYHAAFLVVERLLACGCTQITFLSVAKTQGFSSIDRVNGFRKAIKRSGRADVTLNILPLENEKAATSRVAADALLSGDKFCPAIVAQNDYIAYSVLDALRAHGLVPGKDVMVAGFDNLSRSAEPGIALSSVGVDGASAANRAYGLLRRRLTEPKRYGRCGILLSPRLVFRESFPGK